MTRLLRIDDCLLYHGDCLEVLPKLKSHSIDLVLADPPYRTTQCKRDTIIPLEPMWQELKRLIKPHGVIVLTSSQPFTTTLISSNPNWFRYCWVWEKDTPSGFLDANRKPLKAHEDVLVFGKGRGCYYPQKRPVQRRVVMRSANPKHYGTCDRRGSANNGEAFPRSVLWFACPKKTVHSTQKPVALMQYLIRTYTQEGETVLDFAMGSGTTGVACLRTRRKFIGVEKDQTYFDTACQRIRTRR